MVCPTPPREVVAERCRGLKVAPEDFPYLNNASIYPSGAIPPFNIYYNIYSNLYDLQKRHLKIHLLHNGYAAAAHGVKAPVALMELLLERCRWC